MCQLDSMRLDTVSEQTNDLGGGGGGGGNGDNNCAAKMGFEAGEGFFAPSLDSPVVEQRVCSLVYPLRKNLTK